MLPRVTLEEARSRDWDVIIAGSSFAAVFFAYALPHELQILFVEKGPVQSHDEQLVGGLRGRIAGAESFAVRNTSGQRKDWIAHSVFGGNSNCWWACTPRFHPSDFRMKSLYGVAEDWPFGYEDLAPYYNEIEVILEVAGGGSDHILPRDTPFPYPPHELTRTDRLLQQRSPNWFAQPTARSNGGSRAICCGNGVCHRCPIDAKFTILNSVERLARPGMALLPETEIRSVRIEAGRATGVSVLNGGRDRELTGSLTALGANAIFNAAILIRSGFTHSALGRGLNEQTSRSVLLDGPGLGLFGGTSITGHGYDLYDGPHRREYAGTLIEIYNNPASIRTEPEKWTERATLKLIVEDLPQEHNQVILEDDELVIDWKGHSDYALAGLDRAVSALPDLMPDDVKISHVGELNATEAHLLGTHRMGADPTRHVTSPDLKVHGVDGLYALGGGNFPSSAPANPTLTLAALSIRAGRKAVNP